MTSDIKLLIGGLVIAAIGSIIGMYFVNGSPTIPQDVLDGCRDGSTPADLGYPEYDSCREMEEAETEGMVPGLAGCCLICPAGLVMAGIGKKQMDSANNEAQAVVLQSVVADQVSVSPSQNAQPIQQQQHAQQTQREPSTPSPFDDGSRF
jgi:hypothetical protein